MYDHFAEPEKGKAMPDIFTTDCFVFTPNPEKTVKENMEIIFEHMMKVLEPMQSNQFNIRIEFNSTEEFKQNVAMMTELAVNVNEEMQKNLKSEYVPCGVGEGGATVFMRREDSEKVDKENGGS